MNRNRIPNERDEVKDKVAGSGFIPGHVDEAIEMLNRPSTVHSKIGHQPIDSLFQSI